MWLTFCICFSEPDSNMELAQSGIDFINRVMSRYPEALLQIQPTTDLEFFFMFALKVLDGKEPLPKGSACDFWVCIPPFLFFSSNPN